MKILLDECLPVDLRHSFPGHEANTVEWADFKGKKNGDLLRAAEIAGYAVLLTVDQGMPLQANAPGRKIAILLLVAPSNQLEDLLPLVSNVLLVLQSILPGQVVRLGP
jgi:predicted nuclease of predicted toxin-antitoxin system